jgi:K+-transporting ATPase ATPase C chain
VAKARGVAVEQIQQWITEFTESPDLGLLGEPRVNVLKLNLALDRALVAK